MFLKYTKFAGKVINQLEIIIFDKNQPYEV